MGRRKSKRNAENKTSTVTKSFVFRQVEERVRDVSIQQFADKLGNLPQSSVRTPKANCLRVSNIVASTRKSLQEDDLSETASEEEEAADETELEQERLPAVKGMTVHKADEDDARRHYPPVVWRLIGDYILPEDVSRFGAICRDSYAVVNSPSFWLSLYRDFYRVDRQRPAEGKRLVAHEVVNLPDDLRQSDDYRSRGALLIGLKSKAIRLLYHRYKPFIDRLYSPQNSVPNPHVLVGLHCTEAYCEKAGNSNKSAFKFRLRFGRISKRTTLWQNNTSSSSFQRDAATSAVSRNKEPVIKNCWEDDNEEDDDDEFEATVNPNVILDNPDDDGCVLLAETASLSILPEVFLGFKLHSCALTVSGQSFQYRKLALNFVPFTLQSTQTSSELITVTIQDITRLKLVHWYHPSYKKV